MLCTPLPKAYILRFWIVFFFPIEDKVYFLERFPLTPFSAKHHGSCSCSTWSFCHFGSVDFILLNRTTEIPSSEIISYCFRYYFSDSHRLSFLLFYLLLPLILIMDPSLAPSWSLYHRDLLISLRFKVLHGVIHPTPAASRQTFASHVYNLKFGCSLWVILNWSLITTSVPKEGANLWINSSNFIFSGHRVSCQKTGVVTIIIIILNLYFPPKAYPCYSLLWLFPLFFIHCHFGLSLSTPFSCLDDKFSFCLSVFPKSYQSPTPSSFYLTKWKWWNTFSFSLFWWKLVSLYRI